MSCTASAAIAVASVVAYGAGSASAATRASSKDVRIVLGGGTDFTDASVYQAINALKSKGFRVTLSVLADPSSALEAVVSGKADIYLGDPIEAATAVANGGAKIKYIGSVQQATDYELLSLKQFNLKNLSGATLASAGPGTAGTIIADAALAKVGVNVNSLHAVTVGGTSARVTAILAGEVDLAPVLAPAAVAAVATGKVNILLNAGKLLGRYIQEGLIASDGFVKNDAATVQQVVNAFVDSQRSAAKNESAFIRVANVNQLKGSLSGAEEKSSWQQLKNGAFFAVNGAICPADITLTEHYTYVAGGTLTKKNTPSYRAWVDPSFVKKYLQQHHDSLHAC